MNKKKKLCLVCSTGGHFLQLYSLKQWWGEYDRIWITQKEKDVMFYLKDERIIVPHYPTRRNIKNFIKNIFLSWKIIKKENPDIIISTGAGVSVPFLYIGRILKKKTIYLESMTRVRAFSLSGKLVYPFVDHFIVQWPELAEKYKKAVFKGQIV